MNKYTVNFKADGVIRSEYFYAITDMQAWDRCLAKYLSSSVNNIELINVDLELTDACGEII